MTFALKLLRVKGRASLDFHECFGVRARRGLRAESATFVLQRSRVLSVIRKRSFLMLSPV